MVFLEEGADLVVFVTAPLETRRRRTRRDRGWPEGELERRERHQRPASEAEASVDVVIDNSGSSTEIVRLAQELWRDRVAPRLTPGDGPTPGGKSNRIGEEGALGVR